MLTLRYILRARGLIDAKPCPYPDERPIRRPKPQDEDFIKKDEFQV